MEHDHGMAEHAGELHHVELYAADLEGAVAFWEWLLGELGYSPVALTTTGLTGPPVARSTFSGAAVIRNS